MSIKTAFIFDSFSEGNLDDEVEGAISEMQAFSGLSGPQKLPVKVAYKAEAITAEFMKKSFDLVIIDYGGLSAWGGASQGVTQVDAACRYAESHPGCLVVIWTGYTANIYQDELKETFGHLDNVACRYIDSGNVYKNLDGDPEFIKKFKSWFADDIETATKKKR